MRYRTWLLFAPLLLLAVGLFSAGCLGGNGGAPNSSDIATATPPDTLPEALIVGETLPPAEGTVYIVQAGDTLSLIAEKFGTTIEALNDANDITDPRLLFVGQEIVIPGITDGIDVLGATVEPTVTGVSATATPRPPAATPSGDECTYTVRPGDVAVRIAGNFGISVEELAALNGTTVDDLRSLSVGDALTVPCASPTAIPAPATATPQPAATPVDGQCTYTVQGGDSAATIAPSYGITVEELAVLNGTTVGDLATLEIGDVLIVPCS